MKFVPTATNPKPMKRRQLITNVPDFIGSNISRSQSLPITLSFFCMSMGRLHHVRTKVSMDRATNNKHGRNRTYSSKIPPNSCGNFCAGNARTPPMAGPRIVPTFDAAMTKDMPKDKLSWVQWCAIMDLARTECPMNIPWRNLIPVEYQMPLLNPNSKQVNRRPEKK